MIGLEDDAHRILESQRLPTDVAIERESDPRFAARYFPERDTLAVRDCASDFPVLHEGAHLEHYEKLGRRGKPLRNEPLEFQVGLLLATEFYVGLRLAAVDGYRGAEWGDLLGISSSFPETFMELAEEYASPRDLLGGGTPGVLFSYSGIQIAMRTLPLLGVEVATDELRFFDGLRHLHGGAGFLVRLVEEVRPCETSCLTNRPSLTLAAMCFKAWPTLGFRFSGSSSLPALRGQELAACEPAVDSRQSRGVGPFAGAAIGTGRTLTGSDPAEAPRSDRSQILANARHHG